MALGAVIAAVTLAGCGAAPEEPPQPPPSSPIPSVSASPTESPAPTPTQALAGLTLRQLGFNNGPLDEFSLPSNLQISTRVDQPNVVTIVLASPSPELIEDYLRATLPQDGIHHRCQGGCRPGDDVCRPRLDRRLHRYGRQLGRRAPTALISPYALICPYVRADLPYGKAHWRSEAQLTPRSASSNRSNGRLMPTTLCGSPSIRVTYGPPRPSMSERTGYLQRLAGGHVRVDLGIVEIGEVDGGRGSRGTRGAARRSDRVVSGVQHTTAAAHQPPSADRVGGISRLNIFFG